MEKTEYAGGKLQLCIDGVAARIVLNRPDKRNALTHEMWEAFPLALAAADEQENAKVIILQASAAGAFCAGADIDEFARHASDRDWRRANQAAISATQQVLARTRKPSIAQVSGVCVGGGCGLAMACDIRIADTTARFGITPAKLGLVYSLHDTKLLVDLVGPAHAKMILFSAALIDARQALAIGLVNSVVEPDVLDTAVDKLAAMLGTNSQHSIRTSKQIIRLIADGAAADTPALQQLVFEAFDGPDHAEGVAAFLGKRQPEFPVC
jgi:enoyl-CoA hydratase/carnithine racemase